MSDKLLQCPRCGDPITNELGDNPICGACALASELAVMTLHARIAELESEVVQYKAELDRVLKAHKKAIIRLNEWSPELAQDFVTLLLMDLQKKEEM